MADKRELRVERRDVHVAESGKTVSVVWLECDGERVGPLEPWMVERLQAFRTLYGREVDEGDLLNLEAIAIATSLILKEAQDE